MQTKQTWKIGCGLELPDELDKDTATLVILDLPYYGVVNEEWDNAWKSLDDYLDWCKEWFIKSERVLKDNGSLYYFNSQFKVIKSVDTLVEDVTNLKFRQFITIDKGLQSVAGRTSEVLRTYPKATEYLSFYTFENGTGLTLVHSADCCFDSIKTYLKQEKDKSGYTNKKISKLFSDYYNKIGCLDRSVIEHYFQSSQWCFPTKEIYENVLQNTGYFKRDYESLRQEYESLRFPFNSMAGFTDVWHFDFYKDKRHSHPTQKPFSLIERIVLTSSNENDLVIDPAMGTGTTYKVCKSHNRNFIGRELNPKYEQDIISHAMPSTPGLDTWGGGAINKVV